MRTQVQRTVSRCFAVLRQLCQVRHSVPSSTFQLLIVSLVLSRLDYGNAVLTGLPGYLVCRLQSAMNEAARLIYNMRHSDHITDALISLHWLRLRKRLHYKVAMLMYKLYWIRPSILESTGSCHRYARLSFPKLCTHQPPDSPTSQVVYRRCSGFPCRRTHHLE